MISSIHGLKCILFSLLLIFSKKASSQEFFSGIGIQLDNFSYDFEYSTYGRIENLNSSLYLPGIFQKASAVYENKLAISSYPFLSFHAFGDNNSNFNSPLFSFNAPINIEIYFGDPRNECFFVGAGFSYAILYEYENPLGKMNSIGPQVAMGGQFYIFDTFICFRLAYAHA